MKKQSTHKWIWQNARKQSGFILLQTVLSVAVSLSYVWFALASRKVVDIATGDQAGDLWKESGLLIGILLLQAACMLCNHMLQTRNVGQIEMGIKERIFTALFRKKWQQVSLYTSGNILNRLTGDVAVAANGVSTLIPRLISLIARLISGVVVLLYIDTWFTVIVLVAGTILLLVSRLYGRYVKKIHAACQQTEGETRFFMQESMENWTVLQSFHVSDWLIGRLRGLQKKNFDYKIQRAGWGGIATTIVNLLFSGCYYVALAWGAYRLSAGLITYGTLMAFLQIVNQVQAPFRNMSGVLPLYYNMLASAERLMELEELEDEPVVKEDLGTFQGLRVQDLSFAYDRDLVLHQASVHIKKGECVAIAGYSGIGKSTFFKLLLGFLEPQAGTIVCETDGEDVTAGAATRAYFSYVPQGNLLLSGTIRQNLIFCNENADDHQIWSALEVADLKEFVSQLPEQLDTRLGERGLGLSDGQLQRLAIARGVLYDAPVLLLDEATSALDEETEQRVLKNLRELADKTCICISHRPAALQMCDRVLYIQDGAFEEGEP